MGKKKQSKTSDVNKDTHVKKAKDERSKKTYSIAVEQSGDGAEESFIQKVQLPGKLEKEILDLIQEDHRERKISGDVSKRISVKKLTDLYTCLSLAGFKHAQIEEAMSNTVVHGGDLVDALDWLCLYTNNDQLPDGFSATLQREENKRRPVFEAEQIDQASQQIESITLRRTDPQNIKEKGDNNVQMKDWILQRMEQSSDDELSDEEAKDVEETDPNSRYLVLTALLLDAKTEALQAKQEGNKTRQQEVSKKIREFKKEMESIEKLPDFNPDVKLRDSDNFLSSDFPALDTGISNSPIVPPEAKEVVTEKPDLEKSIKHSERKPDVPSETGCSEEDSDPECGAIGFFENMAAAEVTVEKKKNTLKEDVRNFEYTRQQWTGKSPKQFLIDWIRKHLPRSNAPKFHRKNVRASLWKCRCIVDKKDGRLDVGPEILCDNVKDAEHLAATLALYHLCRGQSVHQLLPPPYRAVWQEWDDAERKAKQDTKAEENKPRDNFIAKLMTTLHLDEKPECKRVKVDDKDKNEGTWEDLADDSDDDVTKQEISVKRKHKSYNSMSSEEMKHLYCHRLKSESYNQLLKTREQLPVHMHKTQILDKIRNENVVVIGGETGSGKSTQIPQFILEEFILNGTGSACNIVCTQPRRISAISLANRVSQELGEQGPGARDSFCGYQIRFESRKSVNTRLTYCTTGVLLRQLQLDPDLKDVSHVIVDEVHERSVQSDFLMIILKQILTRRKDFQVILMSATLNSDKFSTYFQHCSVISVPGRTYPVQVYHVEDIVEMTNFVLDQDSPYALRQNQLVDEEQASLSVTQKGGESRRVDVFWTKENISTVDRSDLDAETYCLHTRNVITRMNHKRINMDIIVSLLMFFESSAEFQMIDGAVLIFLPGLADIQELIEMLKSDRRFSNPKRYQLLALHSVLSSQDQSAAFSVPPQGVRKIVIATNIAETGITIPDVVFVIDSGKAKENRYVESSQMSTLEEVFISRANCQQRQGRAGRVQEGICFRLYTSEMYTAFKPYTVPEILRVPLEELCLHIMKCHLGDPEEFLNQALDPPHQQNVTRAMSLLQSIGACDLKEMTLTPLGFHLAALPIDVKLGKMLIFAAMLGCLESVAVVAAAMTDKSPFQVPLGERKEADVAKMSLATGYSDQLTIYRAYLGWKRAQGDSRQAESTYCQKFYLKRNTLVDIDNLKNELIKLVSSIGFHGNTDRLKGASCRGEISVTTVDMKTIALVKAVLVAGLYPNVAISNYTAPVDAVANPERKACIVETFQGPAQLHPSSVNGHLEANGLIVYNEKVRHNRIYLRDSTLTSPYPLLLFGGCIDVMHTQQMITVDKQFKFKAYAKTGVMFKELRILLDKLLSKKLEDPGLNLSGEKLIIVILKLLETEKTLI